MDDNITNGLTGLINQGNTCYMNSIIQCLSNCKDFRNLILNNNIIHLLNNSDNMFIAKNKLNNTLTFQLRKIFSHFWYNNFKVLELTSFRKIFCKKIQIFRNFNQHDSQEALLCIIDTIHEELAQDYNIFPKNKDIIFDSLKYYNDNNYDYDVLQIIQKDISKYLNFKSFVDFKNTHKNYSDIYNIFEGRTITQLRCPISNGIKANFESHFYFTLSMINNDSVESSESQSNDNSSESNTSESNKNDSNENCTSSLSEYSNNENELDKSYEKYKNLIKLNNYENESNKNYQIKSDSEKSNNNSDLSDNDSENNEYYSIESNNYSDDNDIDDNSIISDQKSVDYESNEYDFENNNNYLNLFTNHKKVKKFNIYELFDNFGKMEILDSENQWLSPYCHQKVNAEKINLIWDSPKVFIILIKRFEYTEHGAEKLNHLVDFPIYNLDISKYLHPNHVSKYTTYNLFAINNHDSMNSNGIDFGHYYSYCKNSIDNKWYNFDDDEVNEIDEDNLVTNKAYMLFYEASN